MVERYDEMVTDTIRARRYRFISVIGTDTSSLCGSSSDNSSLERVLPGDAEK